MDDLFHDVHEVDAFDEQPTLDLIRFFADWPQQDTESVAAVSIESVTMDIDSGEEDEKQEPVEGHEINIANPDQAIDEDKVTVPSVEDFALPKLPPSPPVATCPSTLGQKPMVSPQSVMKLSTSTAAVATATGAIEGAFNCFGPFSTGLLASRFAEGGLPADTMAMCTSPPIPSEILFRTPNGKQAGRLFASSMEEKEEDAGHGSDFDHDNDSGIDNEESETKEPSLPMYEN